MFPVVALFLSVLFEDLAITATTVLGVLLVIAGNLAILHRSDRATPDEKEACQLKVAEVQLEAT